MRTVLGLAVLLGLCTGCVGIQPAPLVAERNRGTLDGLQLGMTRHEVLSVTKAPRVRVRESSSARSMPVPNPHHGVLVPGGPAPAEVIFYYTSVSVEDGLASIEELTPVLLYDGRYVGRGWGTLHRWLGPQRVQAVQLAEAERELLEEQRQIARDRRRFDPVEEELRNAIGRGSYLIHQMQGLQGLQGLGGF